MGICSFEVDFRVSVRNAVPALLFVACVSAYPAFAQVTPNGGNSQIDPFFANANGTSGGIDGGLVSFARRRSLG